MGTLVRTTVSALLVVWLLAPVASGQNKGAADALPAEVQEIIDPDKDGKITDVEAQRGAEQLMEIGNAKEASAKKDAVLKASDQNKDKKVDAKEAAAIVARARGATQQGERLAKLFQELDKDRDGALSKREFDDIEDKLGRGRGQLKNRLGKIFEELDADKNGKLVMEEAMLGAGKLGPRFGNRGNADAPVAAADPLADQVKLLLTALDRDKDGKLSDREARANKELKTKFRQIDTDLDGLLNLEEMTDAARQAQAQAEKK